MFNDKVKIHSSNPSMDDHTIVFPETGFRIPLSLWGVFLYFSSVAPTSASLQDGKDVYILTRYGHTLRFTQQMRRV